VDALGLLLHLHVLERDGDRLPRANVLEVDVPGLGADRIDPPQVEAVAPVPHYVAEFHVPQAAAGGAALSMSVPAGNC
jgi:hypothetical protein